MKLAVIVCASLVLLGATFYLANNDSETMVSEYAVTDELKDKVGSEVSQRNSAIELLDAKGKSLSSGDSNVAEFVGEVRHLGEPLSPDDEIQVSAHSVMHIGEYMDPSVVETKSRFSQPQSLGQPITDVDNYVGTSLSTPILLGERIDDPEAWIARENARSRPAQRLGERKDPEID